MADARRSGRSSEAPRKAPRTGSAATPSRRLRSVFAPAVLVVDDEPVVRNVTARLLTSLGFRPLTAETAHDGLRVIAKGRPRVALVILDVGLPGVGGEAALRLFKAAARDIPVVIASGTHETTLKSASCSRAQRPSSRSPSSVWSWRQSSKKHSTWRPRPNHHDQIVPAWRRELAGHHNGEVEGE